jgi:hypothetical protein
MTPEEIFAMFQNASINNNTLDWIVNEDLVTKTGWSPTALRTKRKKVQQSSEPVYVKPGGQALLTNVNIQALADAAHENQHLGRMDLKNSAIIAAYNQATNSNNKRAFKAPSDS